MAVGPKIPFLLFEFNKMLVMKNHHDRVSQRDSKQHDKTDHRAHRQGAAEKNKNLRSKEMSLLFRSCFSLWKPNQKDRKLCAAATVEPPQEEELARIYHIPIPSQTDLPIS